MATVHICLSGTRYKDDALRCPAYAGLRNALLLNNSQLRALYDACARQTTCWHHNGSYSGKLDARLAFGLLSFQFWKLLADCRLRFAELPLCSINAILQKACSAPDMVAQRRRAVLETDDAYGVWTMSVPPQSPFRVCLPCPALPKRMNLLGCQGEVCFCTVSSFPSEHCKHFIWQSCRCNN